MEPLISATLRHPHRVFFPGDELLCEYQLDAVMQSDVHAVEAAVLWFTEGKGTEDMGVHCFHRRTPDDAEDQDLRSLHQFGTILPNSPLSYIGLIVNIRWFVRIRLFLRDARQYHHDIPFELRARPC